MHGAGGLRDRHDGVGTVAEIEIEIVNLQAAQGRMAGLDHVFAGQTVFVGAVAFGAEEDLA